MFNHREDIQQLAGELFAPVQHRFSPGGARVRLGVTGASFAAAAADLEGFSRPLWGLVPLAVGGGKFDGWELYRRGLASGSDPRHPEFWGNPRDHDQRLVEMAAIGFTLLLKPDLWHTLTPRTRARLAAWLGRVNTAQVADCNWLFFRVLVNLGLRQVGARHDATATRRALDRLEEFYAGDGWYRDGADGSFDYYNPFAFHFYGLIYAKHAAPDDPARARRFRERARKFAAQFIHFFTADGTAIPYGRSLTYRFAQGAFWGALAYANVRALDWGVLKGLYLRHLRWWSRQPTRDNGGLLSIGYGYPNLIMAEPYNSASSPYWAMKAFLPLALPATHPFWRSAEQPLPKLPRARTLQRPGFIISHGEKQTHALLLAGGGGASLLPWLRHGAAKYAKFAYSSHFAFSVAADTRGLGRAGADSMLALSDDGQHFRVRGAMTDAAARGETLYSKWRPWDDVIIETWLLPAMPWHLRVHHIQSGRKLLSAENGFAVNYGDDDYPGVGKLSTGAGFALAVYPAGVCGVRDLAGKRPGQIINAEPNSNLLAPRTLIPSLQTWHAAGDYWLTSAVLGLIAPKHAEKLWRRPPAAPAREKLARAPL
jgi:hypothetical protein